MLVYNEATHRNAYKKKVDKNNERYLEIDGPNLIRQRINQQNQLHFFGTIIPN
jgi:hypothetical protein